MISFNRFIFLFRCTDGIVFVVDSVDVERMEEAKMELMRTAKCPDNQVCVTTCCVSFSYLPFEYYFFTQ